MSAARRRIIRRRAAHAAPALMFVVAVTGTASALGAGTDVLFVVAAGAIAAAVLVVRLRTRAAVAAVPIGAYLGVILIVAVVFAGIAFTGHHRADTRIDEFTGTAAAEVAASAADVLSYRAETVEADVENAKRRLAEPFLGEYAALTAGTVVPQAKAGGVATRWEVSGTSLVTATADRCTVLVFLRGLATGSSTPEPRPMVSSVRVVAVRPAGEWLITELEAL